MFAKDILLANTESTRLNNPVLSESTESLGNVQLTICTPVLKYSTSVGFCENWFRLAGPDLIVMIFSGSGVKKLTSECWIVFST